MHGTRQLVRNHLNFPLFAREIFPSQILTTAFTRRAMEPPGIKCELEIYSKQLQCARVLIKLCFGDGQAHIFIKKSRTTIVQIERRPNLLSQPNDRLNDVEMLWELVEIYSYVELQLHRLTSDKSSRDSGISSEIIVRLPVYSHNETWTCSWRW